MARASIVKRLRLINRIIDKVSGSKKERHEQKRAFVATLLPGCKFFKGPKTQGEGGYK